MDTNTALIGVITLLSGALGAILESIRRGAWVARFVYDREVTRGDRTDARADTLEQANAAQTRAIEDLTRSVKTLTDSQAELGRLVQQLRDERTRAGRRPTMGS
jgi:uncharacterized coiled-coil protein SlyX